MDKQEHPVHSHYTLTWSLSHLKQGRNYCLPDKCIKNSICTQLKSLSFCLSKIFVYLVAVSTHKDIPRESCNNFKALDKTFNQHELVSGKAVDWCQLDFNPSASSSLIPTCFKHWTLSVTLQNFTKVCIFFLVFAACKLSESTALRQKGIAAVASASASSWNVAGAGSGSAWPSQHGLAAAAAACRKRAAPWQVVAVLPGAWAGLPLQEGYK